MCASRGSLSALMMSSTCTGDRAGIAGTVKAQIWDTAGQERQALNQAPLASLREYSLRYRAITSAHYRRAVGVTRACLREISKNIEEYRKIGVRKSGVGGLPACIPLLHLLRFCPY